MCLLYQHHGNQGKIIYNRFYNAFRFAFRKKIKNPWARTEILLNVTLCVTSSHSFTTLQEPFLVSSPSLCHVHQLFWHDTSKEQLWSEPPVFLTLVFFYFEPLGPTFRCRLFQPKKEEVLNGREKGPFIISLHDNTVLRLSNQKSREVP